MTEPATHEFTLDADSELRLDLFLARALGMSRTQAATLIANGNVTVGNKREKASYRPESGDRIVVVLPPPPSREVIAEDIPLKVVYEDDDVLVVDKPAGMVVHPAPGNWTGTLVNALKGRGGALSESDGEDREGIVHRLDKETSGLLLVAKSDRAHRVLGAALQARRDHPAVRRAVAGGISTDDRITVEKPIARDPRDRKRMAVVSTRTGGADGFRAARAVRLRRPAARAPAHRAHASDPRASRVDRASGGGRRYCTAEAAGGKLVELPPRRHFLHAAWLVFPHPVTGESVDLRSPLAGRPAAIARRGCRSRRRCWSHPIRWSIFGFYRRRLPDIAPPPRCSFSVWRTCWRDRAGACGRSFRSVRPRACPARRPTCAG